MEHSFVSALLLMFLMADPLGNIPIFISSLKSVPEHRRSHVVIRECVIAALILCIFAFGGKAFLDALGLSQAALSMGGGLIVLLMAIRMVFPSKEGVFGEAPGGEPFIVPLAVPAIAGPSTLATILLLVGSDPDRIPEWLLVVVLTCAISAAILVFAERVQKIVGERTTAAFERLMGLILATMAVQMFLTGITQFIQTTLKGAI